MRKIVGIVLLFCLILSGGCKLPPPHVKDAGKTQTMKPVGLKRPATAGLTEVPAGEKSGWRIPENLSMEGPNTFCRVVAGMGLLAPQALEMAAGEGSRTEYFLNVETVEERLSYRFQFLSTQGTGRLRIDAIGSDGKPFATVGSVFSGILPAKTDYSVWMDRRLANNYQGGWVQAEESLSELFSRFVPSFAPEKVVRYRVGIEAANGQHVLITELKTSVLRVEGTRIVWKSIPRKIVRGETRTLISDIVNVTGKPLENLSIRLLEPFGYGLTAAGQSEQKISRIPVGGKVSLTWNIKAQRDSVVNLGQPWILRLSVNDIPVPAAVRIDVEDPEPGKIFYVMTEDLEPIDAAGYPTAWGNRNGWLDPEEFRVQLIDKAEALNRIAEKHGAFWTHYLAMPVLEAGEWAAAQSDKPAWRTVLDQVRQSIRVESGRGHEYALHLHSDYDPEVPGNVLSYHAGTDGIWANHLRHGWAHSFPEEGDPGRRATRTGILSHYLKELSRLTVAYPAGEILTARTGSFDFGNGSDSEAMSIRAYRKMGIWGNSDADGNTGGITAGEYGRALYLTPPDDINAPTADLRKLGLVEFRPTPKRPIMYDIDSAATLNEKVRQGIAAFSDRGTVRAGIHSVVGFTHAMFIMGDQDWKNTTGNHFRALEEHLDFLKREYVSQGLLKFGTATTLVREYLDYYWPEPLVLTGPMISESAAGQEFVLDFLGRHIPVDATHRHKLTLQIPVRYWASGLRATLVKNGKPAETLKLIGKQQELSFVWEDRQDIYRLIIGK